MALIETKDLGNPVTIRLEKADQDELKKIAEMIGGKGTVSKLARYAIKKHILLAREEFAKNPDFWKE